MKDDIAFRLILKGRLASHLHAISAINERHGVMLLTLLDGGVINQSIIFIISCVLIIIKLFGGEHTNGGVHSVLHVEEVGFEI